MISQNELKWHQRFINMATEVASWSKDESTKVGAVLVKDRRLIATGFNGFPVGVADDIERRKRRPIKYSWTIHAEHNCVLQAAKQGFSTKGATLYLNFAPPPCSGCSMALIQAGISLVVGSNIDFPGKGDRWKEDLEIAMEMLTEVKLPLVRVIDVDRHKYSYNDELYVGV